MSVTPSRDDRHFRRGVVLGLTMAEILLLLTFLLMLLLASQITKEREAKEEAEIRAANAAEELEQLRPVAELIQRMGAGALDITKEYVRAEKDLAMAIKRLEDAEAALALVEEAREQHDPETPVSEVIESFRKDALLGRAVEQSGGSAEKLLESAAVCRTELSSCQGQAAYLNRRLNEQIGGFGLPPCWADENGRIQYIFDAVLTDGGIVLKDNKVPGREEDQAALPLSSMTYGEGMEHERFASASQPLLKWSDEHECRFYVRLYDGFDTGGRERYKNLRRTVEGYFYILDAR